MSIQAERWQQTLTGFRWISPWLTVEKVPPRIRGGSARIRARVVQPKNSAWRGTASVFCTKFQEARMWFLEYYCFEIQLQFQVLVVIFLHIFYFGYYFTLSPDVVAQYSITISRALCPNSYLIKPNTLVLEYCFSRIFFLILINRFFLLVYYYYP